MIATLFCQKMIGTPSTWIHMAMVAGLLTGTSWPAVAHDLSVATRGGALAAAQQDAYFVPFTQATGIALHVEDWTGDFTVLQQRIGSGVDPWDLVQVGGVAMLSGCDDGLFERLDWPAIGGKDRYIAAGVSDCGVGAVLTSTVLVWDRDKFPVTPTWNDFWDVAKYPGKRGLRLGARMNLEIALMADGVGLGDVYRVLGSDDGVDRAFRKLDQLKPYIAWWKSDAQAVELLASGDVLLTTAPNTRLASLSDTRHFGVQWAGSLFNVDYWVMVKGSANAAAGLRLLAFMGDPVAQARLTAILPYGGLSKGASNGLTPDKLAQAPSNPANLAVSLQIDDQFWRENGARLNERFDTWLAR